MLHRKTGLALAALLALVAGRCDGGGSATSGKTSEPGKPRPWAVLGADLEPFRSDFNARRDHVRAVLLVAPT